MDVHLVLRFSGRLRLAAALLLLALAAPPPPVPEPATLDHVDPAVATLVRDAIAATRRNPGDRSAWMTLGMVYQANEFRRLARTCYEHVVTEDDRTPRAWHMLGLLAVRDGRPDDALEAFARVRSLEPRFGPGFWRAGFIELQRGRPDEAAALFERAAALDPSDPTAVAGLARARMDQGRARDAVDVLTPWRDRPSAQRGYLRFLLGSAHRRLGDRDRAERLLTGAAPGDVRWLDPWEQELGRFQVGLGAQLTRANHLLEHSRFAEATALLESVRRAHPDHATVRTLLGWAWRSTGRFADAEAILRGVLTERPQDRSARFNLAVLLVQMSAAPAQAGRREEATALVDAILADNPGHAQAMSLRGDLFRMDSRLPEALDAYRNAMRRDPSDPRPAFRAGLLLMTMERWPEAAEVLDALCRLTPDDSEAHRALATARIGLRDFAAATTSLEAAAALSPDDPRITATRDVLERVRAETTPPDSTRPPSDDP